MFWIDYGCRAVPLVDLVIIFLLTPLSMSVTGMAAQFIATKKGFGAARAIMNRFGNQVFVRHPWGASKMLINFSQGG